MRRIMIAVLVGLWAQAAAAREISVTFYGALFFGAPYAVALERGYFKDAGTDVTGILSSTGGATTMRNTLAGTIPFGEVALPPVILAQQAGEDVRLVGGGVNTVDEIVWLQKADASFKTWADLKGKKVGLTSQNGVGHMLTLMALKQAGMTKDDVELVVAGGAGPTLAGIKQGSIVTAPLSLQAFLNEEGKGQVKSLFWVHDVMSPKMAQTVLVTTEEFAKKEPNTVKGIIAARKRGVQDIYADPDAASVIIAKAYNMKVEDVRPVIRAYVKINQWSDGTIDDEALNRMAEGMQLVGMLKNPVDWSKLVDRSYLPAK